ncbi:DUF3793 family protein [Heliobacterium chlorum]|uniref:DUF3793 family protein n=1 Tax=Heliobacterium chlorum TaxID=2698 RepID=A0ABR7T752_HELCL|nr:DUF3793 family protein [Heliobacterium chlorum]MBC9786590.1 DUF3793 family protein [Heliobacterium chlorum]
MFPLFARWKDDLRNKEGEQAQFEKWLFFTLSRVLFAGKAGECVRFQEQNYGKTIESTLEDAKNLALQWDVEMFLLKRCEKCAWVIFYRDEQLKTALKRLHRIRRFRKKGYPWPVDKKEFLLHLKEKWCITGRLPHEIGFALGYPLKDVFGFLGLSNQPKSTVCEWCIYGNAHSSLKLKQRFDQASKLSLTFLEENRFDLICRQIRHSVNQVDRKSVAII